MTIPTITDDLLDEIDSDFSELTNAFEYGEETVRKAAIVREIIARIRELEEDAAAKDARIAELETEVEDLHYEVCEAMECRE